MTDKLANRRSFYTVGVLAIVLVLLGYLLATERQAPWEDEIFVVSTGWSMSQGRPPVPSVLSHYPRTVSPLLFYGPVSFKAEAWLIRIFGLSLVVWRLTCFLGVIIGLIACLRLTEIAGGGRSAQLIVGLLIALAGSVGISLPGRWDAVTCGLFLWGLVLLLQSIRLPLTKLCWAAGFAGVLMAFALGSTPRALTLIFSALFAFLLTALAFRAIRVRFLLSSSAAIITCLATHSLLLWPLRETTLGWYRFVRGATKGDAINVTPLTGSGTWSLDTQHHKTLAFELAALVAIALFCAVSQKKSHDPEKLPLKCFLTLFSAMNMLLMLILLANALGQATFWLPPLVVAAACWINWDVLRATRMDAIAVSLISICFLLPSLEELKQIAAVMMTWDQRNTTAETRFIRQYLPAHAPIYGPIGGAFYSAELSGHEYSYAYERTTPGLYSQPRSGPLEDIDKQACTQPTFAIWPKLDLAHHPQEEIMPKELRDRVRQPLTVFNQPPLAKWKERLLANLGPVGGKYGFSDLLIYRVNGVGCNHR